MIALFAVLVLALIAPDAESRSDRSEPQTATSAQSSAWELEIQRSLKQFQSRHRGQRATSRLTQLLAEVEQRCPEFAAGQRQEAAALRNQRLLASKLRTPAVARTRSEFKQRSVGKQQAGNNLRAYPLPRELEYRFGSRMLVPTGKRNQKLLAALKQSTSLSMDQLSAVHCVDHLLHGCLPETELSLAAIQTELDVLESADRLGTFLEAWRHHGPDGDESMYAALDRTAGTPDSPFFYDALLTDFVQQFAGEQGRRWSLDEQHDRLHRAFLSYRQYRGLIEAVAYSLVLPPDLSLPKRLARYDYASVAEGLLSLRHQIDLLVEFASGDQIKVVQQVRDFLRRHPLPDELWQPYSPLGAFSAEFLEQARTHTAQLGLSTDQIWQRRQQAALATAQELRAAIRLALVE